MDGKQNNPPVPISYKSPPHHLRGDLPLGGQPHCVRSRRDLWLSMQPPPVPTAMCWKWKLLAPCARSQSDTLVASPPTQLRNSAAAGVYTAPHANETKCGQSLTLELKIPSYEKKKKGAISLFFRGKLLKYEKKAQRDTAPLGEIVPALFIVSPQPLPSDGFI